MKKQIITIGCALILTACGEGIPLPHGFKLEEKIEFKTQNECGKKVNEDAKVTKVQNLKFEPASERVHVTMGNYQDGRELFYLCHEVKHGKVFYNKAVKSQP
ncbi:MAG: hypothetical protein WBK55_10250 [Alphaproteobacteria bacterium]